MGTDFCILLPLEATSREVDAAVSALDQIEHLEQCFTIYDPTSELSQVNRLAGERPVRLSNLLFRILMEAQHISAETQGAFDVTAGPLVDIWGFTNRSGQRPTDDLISETLRDVGWQYLELNPTDQSVRFARPKMKVNLGAIGKGFALDYIRQQLQDAAVENYLIHGGNSSMLAQGSSQKSRTGWRIGLQHPLIHKRRLGGLWLQNKSLGTSGSGKQHFHYQGKRLGHVIDPRTGWPGGDLLSLTLVTNSATQADALATALFVAGRDAVAKRARQFPEEGWVAVSAGGRQGEVVVESWNTDAIGWEPATTLVDGDSQLDNSGQL
jgi:thiamine biosynthesis lipoprotein